MPDDVALFVSHPWRLSNRKHSQRLVELLRRSGLGFKITSIRSMIRVNSTNSSYLRRKIRDRLAESDALVFVAGRWVQNSKWMQFEIKEALRIGIPVIAVRRHGADETTYIETELDIQTVGWNSRSIKSRITEKVDAHAQASARRIGEMTVERVVATRPAPKPGFWRRLFGVAPDRH